ncbi:MAG TPA: proton-conducting transporter membrane subunit, partial [Gaiellaceae bacterium]|nr:proton-conducting transporter membrane subunit [Gaiellaceae bacterium]
MTWVLGAAFLLLAAAILAARLSSRGSATVAAAACALLGVVGVGAAAGWWAPTADVGGWLGFGDAGLVADRLGGIFLALTGIAGTATSLAWVEQPPQRLVAALHGLVLLATAAFIGSNQAFLSLVAWETITLGFYLLASADRERPGTLLAAYFSTGLNKLSGAALLAAFALLYGRTGSFQISAWTHAQLTGGVRTALFVLFLVGFGAKVGLLPLQGALPLAYRAAPGAAAATMTVATGAGFYGLWRYLYATLGADALWWGETLIIAGAVGALVGILYAIAQTDIRRFLGFSSVEHGGIALIGLGVALIGQAAHEPKLAAVGLLAGTLHVFMHGIAKTLAFLAAARTEAAAGSDDLEPLGGLSTRLPRTAAGFAVAVLTLAAMPPLGGFVSEWFTLEALLQAFRLHDTLARLLMALAGALLALTAGLGLLAFAKILGTVFLGRPRSDISRVREPAGPAAGMLVLTGAALGLGVAAPWEIRWLGSGLHDLLGFDLATTTISHPLVLGPVYPGFSVLAPTWLAVALLGYGALTLLLVRGLARPRVRRAPVWVSGTAGPLAERQYTPAAYSNPV